MEKLLNILLSAIGSLTNPTKLSATFKSVKQKTISNTTIKRYIDYLCDFFKKIIIMKDAPAPYYNDDGALVMSLYDFLLNENSLDI